MRFKSINLPFNINRPILAVGAQTKNMLCFAKGNLAMFSPLHSDLSNPGDFLNFKKDVKYFLKKRPKIIVYDLHPEYQSTKYALSLPTTYYLLPTQHHHAHIASCMAENGLKNQKVIGVAFDGTGLGSDNTIWGAEFLICDYKNFKRIAHLKRIPLLGGEKAISEPWRLGVAWLYLAYKDRFLTLGIDFIKGIDKNKWRVLKNMYLVGVNSPLASSMGRLFDAVATLILGKDKVRFEAELAIKLEKLALRSAPCALGYPFKILKNKEVYIIDPLPLFRQIILDLKHKESQEKIAYKFHLTVAEMIKKMCLIIRKEVHINKVVLSGGVFQNNLLHALSLGLLSKEDFDVFMHKELSCNDSGISLGQAVVANFRS